MNLEESSESMDENSQLLASPSSKSETLLEVFESDKSYKNLVPLLERELKTKQFLELLEHSEEGLSLFPAQPFVYLMKGTALIQLRKNAEAFEVLQEGLDYLIDDPEMEVRFLEQLSLASKAMGDNKKATEYFNRAQEIRIESLDRSFSFEKGERIQTEISRKYDDKIMKKILNEI